MLDILNLGEEMKRGGNKKGLGFIVSTSLTKDEYCCGLAIFGRLLWPKDVACRAIV
jgi:hypothetical protein